MVRWIPETLSGDDDSALNQKLERGEISRK